MRNLMEKALALATSWWLLGVLGWWLIWMHYPIGAVLPRYAG